MSDTVQNLVKQERELRELWQKGHELRLSTEKAALEYRLTEMNSLRRQIEMERGSYITRDTYDRDYKETIKRLDDVMVNMAANKSQIWFMGAIITVIVSFIAVSAEIAIRAMWK